MSKSTRRKLSDGIHIITIAPDATQAEIISLLRSIAAEWLNASSPFGDLATILNGLTTRRKDKSVEEIFIDEIQTKIGNPDNEYDYKIAFAHAVAAGKIDPALLQMIAKMQPTDPILLERNQLWLPDLAKCFVTPNSALSFIFG